MVETTCQPVPEDHGSHRLERKLYFSLATPFTKSFAFVLILQICNFGFGGANADDNGSKSAIPNEGAQGPNFAVDGEGWRRSTQRPDPIERLVPGANNTRGYPETVWKSDANGRLERFNLWKFYQGLTKLAKLNRDVFTLTLGSRQIPH